MGKCGVFSKNTLSYEKPTKVCAYHDIIWRRWREIIRPFLVLLKSNGRLQATWHSKAASFSRTACTGAGLFCFRILSITCSLTHALSKSHPHAQQLFSASTPGQIIIAPRVCTLVLFILSVMRELTSPVIDRVKNKLNYSAADGGQKICGIFSETASLQS